MHFLSSRKTAERTRVPLVRPLTVSSRPQACIIFLEEVENHLLFGKYIYRLTKFQRNLWSGSAMVISTAILFHP